MSSRAEAPLQGNRSPLPRIHIALEPPVTGNVTIASTGGILGLSGSGTGWLANGNVITFEPPEEGNNYYSLSLQLPQGWAWNASASLEIFQGGDNLCGFYSNIPSIGAFNSSTNQTQLVFTAVLNMLDANEQPVSFTVFLHFPADSSNGWPTESPATPMPIPSPISGHISGTAQVENSQVNQVTLEGSGQGWSATSTENGGLISLKPDSGSSVSTWHLTLEIEEGGWELGSSPAFEICTESNQDCGVVFAGPVIKAYNYLAPESERQKFVLGIKLTNGTLTQWIDDPTVAFDPPDPPV